MSRRRYPLPRRFNRGSPGARLVRTLIGCLWLALAAVAVLGAVKGWR